MSRFTHLKGAGKAQFKDRFTKKANELLSPWEEGRKGDIALIGAPLSKSSISHSGASFAPDVIRRCLGSYSTFSIEDERELSDNTFVDFGDILMHPTSIVESQNRIYESLSQVLTENAAPFTIVLGGDHSISTSSIEAFAEHKGRVGVIQFDAHHDLRNVEDGGPTNGTPFRRLLERGILKGEDLVQIGIRNYSNAGAYYQYAMKNDVGVYTMKEVRERNIGDIMKEALEMLESKVDTIYLSVDMDVLDQAFAPGCPAIGPGGMDSATLMEAVSIGCQHPKTAAMDIVEIDPTLDIRDMTSRIAAHLLLNCLKARTS
ncbi:formimidoylglutamase [Bacillus salacetis]|uniref:Formimidoylglutamase n=1 Tax=Bacillus salacetis TaxID=2315464 RepID=A0A3A1R6Z8_9BACI|nr:formimidoylglutamase [Bacillus salacetis]RIW36079.1 formimidoylglutamase [Bacillus salacetis]